MQCSAPLISVAFFGCSVMSSTYLKQNGVVDTDEWGLRRNANRAGAAAGGWLPVLRANWPLQLERRSKWLVLHAHDTIFYDSLERGRSA